jgi:hypothetical protein
MGMKVIYVAISSTHKHQMSHQNPRSADRNPIGIEGMENQEGE